MNISKSGQITIKGISGSPGICIGKAYIVDREGVNITKRYPVSDVMVPKEIDRFKQAVSKAKNDHAKVIDSLDKDLGENLNILETHMVLFKDKMLYGKTIDTISNEKINAEWALRKVSRKVKSMFQQIDDIYLQARVIDIVQVSDKIMSYLVGAQDIKISDINKRVIL
ncbi:MAG: phosphoenolpyruvate--protein phosphotransferase, partial [Desulfobacteraceae bacterium]|nr:phosphoenolpyruvate--protein phosphotransferase [Desulfobacteraceae bacterium]